MRAHLLSLTCSGRDVLRAADRCWAPTNEDEDTTKACAGASSATAVAMEAATFMTTAVVFVRKRETSRCWFAAPRRGHDGSVGASRVDTKLRYRGGGGGREN